MKVDGVSVIVPTYGDFEHLGRALDSVLGQSIDGVDIEIIVIDSSDTDVVRSIVAGYADNVRYRWRDPEGVAAARNYGITLATHEVIGFCDADDYWHRDKLKYQLPTIEAGYDLVYSDEYLVSGGSVAELDSPEIQESTPHHITYFREGGVGSRSILVRRECLMDERFDERFVVREDPHLWTRLFEKHRVARVPKPLSYKRRRPDSLTADRDRGFLMELMEIRDLVGRYPELRPYRNEREARAKLQYAKTLLSDENRSRDARRVLVALLSDGHFSLRIALFLLISLVPGVSKRVLRTLQRAYWRL